MPKKMSTHRLPSPRRQAAHWPHGGFQHTMTWSPTETRVTPSPTATTSPAPSWPGTNGTGCGSTPVMADRSEWHTPVARMRIFTWPGPGSERVRSSRTVRVSAPVSNRTAARMVVLTRF
ncbi:MAG: hypothetical protein AUG49_17605 [Catenulispora sp. 13_1_20CM_3_70_7]|nr:MAG: hypothetical protein AUG49_17605 [Catenulispora sp. 13_1_20CM_3_70_7]